MRRLSDLKATLMETPGFGVAYAAADIEYSLIEALVRARAAAGLSQAELATRIGTTQSAIARLEAGRVSPSIKTLKRYAEATGSKLRINLDAA